MVFVDWLDIILENNIKKEKEIKVDCGEKLEEREVGEDEYKVEEKEIIILLLVMVVVLENIVMEEIFNDVNESVLIVDK